MSVLSKIYEKRIGLHEWTPTIRPVLTMGDILDQRRVNVQVFSKDHQEAYNFATEMQGLSKRDPCKCARKIVDYFNTHMVPHFAAEEVEARKVIYYPYLKQKAYALIEQHNNIRNMIRFIAENCDSPQVAQMINRWCNAIHCHIVAEENGTLYTGADGTNDDKGYGAMATRHITAGIVILGLIFVASYALRK